MYCIYTYVLLSSYSFSLFENVETYKWNAKINKIKDSDSKNITISFEKQ